MPVSNIYVYFNNKGELVSKAPYIDNGPVRQGDDFLLNILFDKGTTSPGEILALMFKIPTEEEYNLFPFLGQNYVTRSQQVDSNLLLVGPTVFKEEAKDLSKFGIYKGVEYDCWTFNSSEAYNGKALLTNLDGNLEVQVIKYPENTRTTYTRYLGTFKIFVERTLHYTSPFDVKQEDLDRFIEEVKSVSENTAEETTVELLPGTYVIDIEPETFTDVNGDTRTEKLTLVKRTTSIDETTKVVTQTDVETEVEMPLPLVNHVVTVNSSYDEEQSASASGTGKQDDPLSFNFNLYKARDGYGIHLFYIDPITGDLMVKAERSDDLEEGNYRINENGELVVEI